MFERNTSLNVASREEKKAAGVLDARSVVVDESKRVAANDSKMIRPRVDISQLSDEDIRAGFPTVSPEIREAGARLRAKVRLAKIERGNIQGEQPVVHEPRVASQEQPLAPHQNLPLSSQALRFEIQTREEQLKTLQDQGERIRIQSQLQAYRNLLEENEPRVAHDGQLASQNVSLRATSARVWKRVKGWFSW
ncbi:MAG: hypothetical protein QG606_525 [Patescibacteria group bacterium]|nr:hypothetical protein [Patescibacteria group bacterium]